MENTVNKKAEKKPFKERFCGFFSSIWYKIVNWYRTSKVSKVFEKIGRFISYAFWPLAWVKHRTFDKIRFENQKKICSLLFLLPVLIGFLVFFIYPLIMSLIYSFSTLEITTEGILIHFSKFFTTLDKTAHNYTNPVSSMLFYNYKYAFFTDADFPLQLWNTISTTVTDTLVITIFSLFIAVLLNSKFKCRGLVRAVFFLPVIFNSEAITTALASASNLTSLMGNQGNNALTTLFDMGAFLQGVGIPKGLVTFLTGITDAIYDTISYSGIQILIFLTAIQSVPKHLYEAAKMEGATNYEMFWKITLPMVSPMILTVVVYSVVDSFLRSSVNKVIQKQETLSEYGFHAAMSWSYLLCIFLLLFITLGILSKVVFYYDDEKH